MTSYFGAIGSRKETQTQRLDRAKAALAAQQSEAAKRARFGKPKKIALMAQAIVNAAIARGAVTILDITQGAGVSKKDAERYFEPAMAAARKLDPKISVLGIAA